MNNRFPLFVQAVRGPLLLILVGVLFALHQSGALSFRHSWPLIVIAVGVMKLLERLAVPPGGGF